MFEGYKDDYVAVSREINKAINELAARSKSESRQREVAATAKRKLREAEDCLKALDVEARTFQGADRRRKQEEVSRLRADLTTLRRDVDRAVESAERSALTGGGAAGAGGGRDGGKGASRDQRERLMGATDALNRSTANLESARRIVAETEEIGVGIMTDMESQREVLLSAHAKVHETQSFTKEAQRVLKTMGRRAITNKIVLWCVIIALLASIGCVVYYMYIKK